MADIKALEHSTLKVPYELLNKKFRVAQKIIDREVSHVTTATSDLEQCLGTSNVNDVAKALDIVVQKLSVLKRKAEESINEENEAAKSCKRRVEHLKEYEQMDESGGVAWRKRRVNRMLVEYFLRAGYYNTALKLARQMGIEDLTNIDLFLVSRDVEASLENRDISKCLTWCHDNKSKLRKLKSTLEFNLRRQEFVELVRAEKRFEAVKHARKYFTNIEDEQLLQVQQLMGILAFSADTTVDPYKHVFDAARWQDLVQQFRQENFKMYQLNNDSVFSVCLQSGLSALKTPHCYKDAELKKTDCPVCSKHLNDIARSLPFAHCSQSRLICSISGQPMNENNPPMMLPNGYVYGLNALAVIAAANDGRLVCPRTKRICDLDEALKVFVM